MKRIVPLVVVAIACILLIVPHIDPLTLGKRDFAFYWAAGRLALQQHNPYDHAAIQPLEQSLGFPGEHPIVPREPPWFLWTTLPFGMLPPMWAWAIWLSFSVISLMVSAHLCWRLQGWQPSDRRMFVCATWLFAPVLACLSSSQLGFMLLLGVMLFMWFEGRSDFWAGASLLLMAIKPQLFSIIWVVLLLWVMDRKRWSVAFGALSALAFASGIAILIDSNVFANWYRGVFIEEPIAPLLIPSLAGIFRALFFRRALWMQFVPAALGMAWVVRYYLRNRENWNWRTHGLGLLPVCLLVTPYEWFSDEVIVLPALLQVALWLRRSKRTNGRRVRQVALVCLSGLLLLMVVSQVPMPSGVYFWSALVWYGWWRLGRRESLSSAAAIE